MAEDSGPEDFSDWVGRSIETRDDVVAGPVRRLAATLDHDGAHWPTDALPLLGHWLFTVPDAPRSQLGVDGHPQRGGFLPPIPQPRRMWAGGRLHFIAPIRFGTKLTRRTTIRAIDAKANGMTFMTLLHEIAADGVAAVEEEQDLVYLPITAPSAAKPVPRPEAENTRHMVADAVTLFRFSALTFNSHRIHYDAEYARDVELYPGLVVHGPLQAMLLLDQAVRHGMEPTRFAFRARAPLYAGTGFTLARAGNEAWVRDDDDRVTMTATVS